MHNPFSLSCFEHVGVKITQRKICDSIVSEVVFPFDYYKQSAADDQDVVVTETCRFVLGKDYNTDTCDLLLSALSTAFKTTVSIFQYQEETKQ